MHKNPAKILIPLLSLVILGGLALFFSSCDLVSKFIPLPAIPNIYIADQTQDSNFALGDKWTWTVSGGWVKKGKGLEIGYNYVDDYSKDDFNQLIFPVMDFSSGVGGVEKYLSQKLGYSNGQVWYRYADGISEQTVYLYDYFIEEFPYTSSHGNGSLHVIWIRADSSSTATLTKRPTAAEMSKGDIEVYSDYGSVEELVGNPL